MTTRIPSEVRALRGTSRRDRNATPPAPATLLPRVLTPPPPPAWLTHPAAIEEWSRASTALSGCGLLRDGSLATLGHYCHLHGALVDAYDRNETPRAAYLSAFRNLAASLGLVLPPMSRAPDPAKTVNRFAKFKKCHPPPHA